METKMWWEPHITNLAQIGIYLAWIYFTLINSSPCCAVSVLQKHKLAQKVLHQVWNERLLKCKYALQQAKSNYYSDLIYNNRYDPKFLFNTMDNLTKTTSPTHLYS